MELSHPLHLLNPLPTWSGLALQMSLGGGCGERGISRRGWERWIGKGAPQGPLTGTAEPAGQKDRHTFFSTPSRHEPIVNRHDPEAHTSSIFSFSLPTRTLSKVITRTAISTHLPWPWAGIPLRRSTPPLGFASSLGVLPIDHAVAE